MLDLTKEIKEKAERVGCEMKSIVQDFENEMRDVKEMMKVNAERLSDEIKRRIMK